MDSIDDLKNDIVKSNTVVKHEQEILKEKIEKGVWDDMDTFFDNPDNRDYYQRSIMNLNKGNKPNDDTVKEGEKTTKTYGMKGFWKRVEETLFNMIKGSE